MSKRNKIAQAIEEAYANEAKKHAFNVEDGINPINDMSMDTGIELAYLFSKYNTDCDPMTDWSSKMYDFEFLIKDLLVLIGKPGVLKKLHPSTQKKASFHLMKLLTFFQSLNDKDTTCDWLTWLMYDQFNGDKDHNQADQDAILRNLHVNQ